MKSIDKQYGFGRRSYGFYMFFLLFIWLLKDSMKHNYDYEVVINKFLRGQNLFKLFVTGAYKPLL